MFEPYDAHARTHFLTHAHTHTHTPKGPCTHIVYTLALKYSLYRYIGPKVYTIWVHGPLGPTTHTHIHTHTHMFGSLTRSRPVRFGSTLRNSMLIEKVLQRYPKAITMASQHANRIKISPSPSAPSLAKPRLPKEMESFQLFHLARSSLPKARSNSQSLLSWSQRL